MAEKVPKHIGIILDGNRRWARERGMPVWEGHRKGAQNIRRIVKQAQELGVDFLTLFVWSEENWKRQDKEVEMAFKAAAKFFKDYAKEADEQNIRIRAMGHPEKLPEPLKGDIFDAEESTKDNDDMQLIFCTSYSGRSEIVEAARSLVEEGVEPREVTKEEFENHLYLPDVPDPELIIRTSGEQRLSGFLTWQSVYSELYFVDKFWPSFSPEDLEQAVKDLNGRERRYGQ